MNVTATQPSTAGYLTVYPCDTELPNASNVNFVAGQTRPNAAIVGTGTNGEICVYASTTTNVIVDVMGYFGAADGTNYWPHISLRRWDSRSNVSGGPAPRLNAGTFFTYTMSTSYRPGDVAVLNVTIAEPSTAGFVSVYPCAQGVPATSNLNFAAGQTVANTVMVKLDANRRFCVYTSAPTYFIIDQNGTFFTART
jgi:hypothetical protein